MVKRIIFQKFYIVVLLGVGLLILFFFFPDMTAADASIDRTPEEIKQRNSKTSFFWTVGIIGGIIALTLSYVSWRKFKGERNNQTKKM